MAEIHPVFVVCTVRRIPSRIGRVSPVVVVDNVSPVCNTRYVCGIGNCASGIGSVLKTQYTIFFCGRVGNVNRKSQESRGVSIACI